MADVGSRQSKWQRTTTHRVINEPGVFKWAVVRHPWTRVVQAYRDLYLGQCRGSALCMETEYGVPRSGSGESVWSLHDFIDRKYRESTWRGGACSRVRVGKRFRVPVIWTVFEFMLVNGNTRAQLLKFCAHRGVN